MHVMGNRPGTLTMLEGTVIRNAALPQTAQVGLAVPPPPMSVVGTGVGNGVGSGVGAGVGTGVLSPTSAQPQKAMAKAGTAGQNCASMNP